MLLKAQSRKASNYITFDGTEANSVHVKVEAIKERVYHIPMYRMYVEGKDNIPTIRMITKATMKVFRLELNLALRKRVIMDTLIAQKHIHLQQIYTLK